MHNVYYGWVITVTLAITETISWGILYYAFTVFLTPMERELGWSRAELTGGFSLALLVMGGLAFPVGWWIDRHGARLLMTVGSAAASLLMLAWSQVTDPAAFYLIWIGLGACMAAVLYEPAFAVVAAWFVRRRGKALALITFAGGLASTIFVPLSDGLMNALGWREAIFVLGVLLAVTTIPLHALVLRRRPHDLGLLPDGGTLAAGDTPPQIAGATLRYALHSRYFWVLTFAFAVAFLAASAIRVHFIPFLTDRGIDASTAAFASGAIGLMQVLGRLAFAPLEMRLSGRVLVLGVFALQGLAMSILLLGDALWLLIVFVVVFGTSYGAQTLARALTIAEHYGAVAYGQISSVMAIFLTAALTLAPVGAGLIHDHYGSYDLVLVISVALAALATAVIALARRDPAVEVEVAT